MFQIWQILMDKKGFSPRIILLAWRVTYCVCNQAANLAGFRASEDPRFEAGIPDFMNGILNFSIHFNVVHRKVDWRNPKMKSLNSMPGNEYNLLINLNAFPTTT